MAKPRKQRFAAKEQAVVEKLRNLIISGRYAPEERLPIRRELHRKFNVSSVTVQRAMDTLTEDGFIRAQGRAGSFISTRPPHLTRFGLAFLRPNLSRFWAVLRDQASALAPEIGCDFAFYLDIAGHTDSPDYQRLAYDVQHKRLAGLFYTHRLQIPLHQTFFSKARIPLVVQNDEQQPDLAECASLRLDNASWRNQAVTYLKSRGRRRIAVLTIPGVFTERTSLESPLISAIQAAGLITRPAWVQATEAPFAEWASHAVQAMFQLPRGERPDGLIITDDHLVEAGARGLKAMNLRTPEDLDVVAHCNYPALPKVDVPVCWLGFDSRSIILNVIRLLRKSQTEMTAVIPALFEKEWRVANIPMDMRKREIWQPEELAAVGQN